MGPFDCNVAHLRCGQVRDGAYTLCIALVRRVGRVPSLRSFRADARILPIQDESAEERAPHFAECCFGLRNAGQGA